MSNPFHETLNLTMFGKMGRVHRLCRVAVSAAVQPLGLTESRWTAMVHLTNLGEGSTQQMLADSLGIEMPPVTRTLKHLEQAEIIERRVGEQDKRNRHLFFTDKGLALLEQLRKVIALTKQELYSGLNDDELDTAARVLVKMENNALRCHHKLITGEE